MDFHKIIGGSHTGGGAAVGADLSAPRDAQTILLKFIIGPHIPRFIFKIPSLKNRYNKSYIKTTICAEMKGTTSQYTCKTQQMQQMPGQNP